MARKVMNGLDLMARPIENLADPSAPQQAATKNYVDSAVRGLDWKQEVVAASTGNVNLASPAQSSAAASITRTSLVDLASRPLIVGY